MSLSTRSANSDSLTSELIPDSIDGKQPAGISDLFQALVRSGVFCIGGDDMIAAFDDDAGEFLGIDPSIACGSPLTSLPSFLQSAVSHLRETGEPRMVRIPQPGGTAANIRIALKPATGPGTLSVFVVTNTDRVAVLEEHVRRLDRLANIGTLSASAAHEIKNGLVSVKAFVDSSADSFPDREMAELVQREVRRVDVTASQLLRFSGPGESSFSQTGIHRVLQNTVKLVQHQADQKDIDIVTELGAIQDTVLGNDTLLGQAFINLLLNAIEAISGPGSITLKTSVTRKGPSAICVTVSDTGEGIAPENVRHLFNRFFTTKSDGNGLGLAITDRIIREHKGSISVESEFGKGTTFFITIPQRSS